MSECDISFGKGSCVLVSGKEVFTPLTICSSFDHSARHFQHNLTLILNLITDF